MSPATVAIQYKAAKQKTELEPAMHSKVLSSIVEINVLFLFHYVTSSDKAFTIFPKTLTVFHISG